MTKPLGGDIEAEFTKLIDAEAQATRKAGGRPATAFDRYLEGSKPKVMRGDDEVRLGNRLVTLHPETIEAAH
ncbi:hypothetical protein ACVW1C_007292 [Bradyrhizobium sp. USDA 4011]